MADDLNRRGFVLSLSLCIVEKLAVQLSINTIQLSIATLVTKVLFSY